MPLQNPSVPTLYAEAKEGQRRARKNNDFHLTTYTLVCYNKIKVEEVTELIRQKKLPEEKEIYYGTYQIIS